MTYLREETMQKIIADNPEGTFSLEKFWAQGLLEIIQGNYLEFENANLNQLCPHVRPVKVEEFLKIWWTSA